MYVYHILDFKRDGLKRYWNLGRGLGGEYVCVYVFKMDWMCMLP